MMGQRHSHPHAHDGAQQPSSRTSADAAACVGLLTLRLQSLALPQSVARTLPSRGEPWRLRIVMTLGLRGYTLSAPATCTAPSADGVVQVRLAHALRSWVARGEEGFIASISLFAELPAVHRVVGGSKDRVLPLGQAWAPTGLLLDGRRHTYVLGLHGVEEGGGRLSLARLLHAPRGAGRARNELGMTDADHNRLVARMNELAASPPPPSPLPDGEWGAGRSHPVLTIYGDVGVAANSHKTLPLLYEGEGGGMSPPGTAVCVLEGGKGGYSLRVHSRGLTEDGSGLRPLPTSPTAAEEEEEEEEEEGEGVVDVEGEGGATLSLLGSYQPRDAAVSRLTSSLLAQFDANGDGRLDYAEVVALLTALGHSFSKEEMRAVLSSMDADSSGCVDAGELTAWLSSPAVASMSLELLAFLAEGASSPSARSVINDLARTSRHSSRGGASRVEVADAGRLVVDELGLICLERTTGLLVQERIPRYVKLAIALLYHSAAGELLHRASSRSVRSLLHALSMREGSYMDSPRSARDIGPFARGFGIDTAEIERPLGEYASFNSFFSRRLKPGARPIACPEDEGVAVCPADCRLAVFESLADAQAVWVKGRGFTLPKLFGPYGHLAPAFEGCALAIARLAPQDYHRWHVPFSASLGARHAIPGALFTVNPIAIRAPIPDVYGENKREVCVLHSPVFGTALLVAVGATCVGSIHVMEGQSGVSSLKKGEEHGYFSFGGSTVLLLLQRGSITFDADLLANSLKPLETVVAQGSRLGVATGTGVRLEC